MKITNSSVDRIPYTKKGQEYYWDDTVKGFGVRVGQNTKSYIAQHDINRKTCVYTIGKHGVYDADKARKAAKEALVEMGNGINPNERKRVAAMRGITLREASELLFGMAKPRAITTIKGYKGHLERYLAPWLDKELKNITRDMARELHIKLTKNNGKYAANAALRTFRAIWHRAMRQDETLPPCPTINVDWNVEKRKQCPIPPEELAAWYDGIMRQKNPVRRDVNLLMLFTGLRRTDAATVRWEDIDFAKKTLHRPKPKGGFKRAFTVPLTDFIVSILQRRKEENEIFFPGSPWVFPAFSKAGHIVEPKEIGMRWSAHRLRDSYVTCANAAGLPVFDIEVLVNHRVASSSITAGYVRQSIEQLRLSQQKVTDYLLACIFSVPADDGKVVPLHVSRT